MSINRNGKKKTRGREGPKNDIKLANNCWITSADQLT